MFGLLALGNRLMPAVTKVGSVVLGPANGGVGREDFADRNDPGGEYGLDVALEVARTTGVCLPEGGSLLSGYLGVYSSSCPFTLVEPGV